MRPVISWARRNVLTVRGVSPFGSTETATTWTRRASGPICASASWRLLTMSGQTSGQWE